MIAFGNRLSSVSASRRHGCVGVCSLLLVAMSTATPAGYLITDLHGSFALSWPAGLSADGRVVGYWTAGGFETTYQAFYWTPDAPNAATGTQLDLGNFGWSDFRALGVNSSGQIACTGTAGAGGASVGYVWQNGTLARLETDILPGGCHPYTGCGDPSFMNGGATSINESGQVAGYQGFQNSLPTFWADPAAGITGSNFAALAPSGYGFAYALNDSGAVVGQTNYFGETAYGDAFLQDGTLHNLGLLEGTDHSSANAINNSGLIVGNVGGTNSFENAFVYSDDVMQDIHVRGVYNFGSSVAYGVNDSAQVVGSRFDFGGGSRAFYWDSTQGMIDLNDLLPEDAGMTLTVAYKINNFGQIIARTTDNRAVLLTPKTEIFGDGFE